MYNQTYKDWLLYVRDDGSVDNTLEIIKHYNQIHNNIIVLEDNQGGLGASRNFITLLKYIDAEYYMFCDHDDVWLPTKIEKTFLKIKEIEQLNLPAVVCTNLCVVDKELNVMHKSMWDMSKLRPQLLVQKKYAVSQNIFTGCTMLINRSAKDIINYPMQVSLHDRWIALRIMAENGIVGYIEEPLILYRQHGNNVCGVRKVGGVNYLLFKIKNIRRVFLYQLKSYKIAKEAFNGKLNLGSFLFYKLLYQVKR